MRTNIQFCFSFVLGPSLPAWPEPSPPSLPQRRVAAHGIRLTIPAEVGLRFEHGDPAVRGPAHAQLSRTADELTAEAVRHLRPGAVEHLDSQLLAPARRHFVREQAAAATSQRFDAKVIRIAVEACDVE